MGNKAEEQKETPFFGFVGMMAAWLGMRYWKWVRGGGGTERRSQNAGPTFFGRGKGEYPRIGSDPAACDGGNRSQAAEGGGDPKEGNSSLRKFR